MSAIEVSAKTEKASNYCTYCPKMCRFACPVAEAEARETVTPWGLMGLLYAVRDGSVPLTEEVGEAFFHCTSCLRCQTYCRHDNDIPAAMIEARTALVERGLPLPKPLQGLDLVMQEHGSPFGEVPELADSAHVFEEGAEVIYVPACARRAHLSETVLDAGRVLKKLLGEPIGVLDEVEGRPNHCCGGSLEEAGYTARAQVWRDKLAQAIDGYRLVVTDCTSMIEALKARPGAPQVMHLVQVIDENAGALLNQSVLSGPEAPVDPKHTVLHDACTVGRRLGLYDASRRAVEMTLGEAPQELWQCREKARCCGGGGHYPHIDPEGAAESARIFMKDIENHGAETVVLTEARCVHHLRAHEGDGNAKVVDLITMVAQALDTEG